MGPSMQTCLEQQAESCTCPEALVPSWPHAQVFASDIVSWGLRVRMCAASGVCQGKKVSPADLHGHAAHDMAPDSVVPCLEAVPTHGTSVELPMASAAARALSVMHTCATTIAPGPFRHMPAARHVASGVLLMEGLLCVQMNQNTKRMEYEGSVFNAVMALAELAHGGQILIDEASFDGIKSSLPQLQARVSTGPSLDNLQGMCRYGPVPRDPAALRGCSVGACCSLQPAVSASTGRSVLLGFTALGCFPHTQ